MLRLFVLLMIVIPVLEIWMLISLGKWIGGWNTFGLIVLTGLFGVVFVKKELSNVWKYAQFELNKGQMPGQSVLDGLCLVVGGVLLVFPGLITDVIGLLFVLPPSRIVIRTWMTKWFRKKLETGKLLLFFRR